MKHTNKIDQFRLVAAVMVIAIHTAPLESYHPTFDFVITQIWGRMAVPFFLMTSGYFIFGSRCGQIIREKKSLIKLFYLYCGMIVLYLPLNIYNGYFNNPSWPRDLIFDFLFNGTFYHLWYLPAAFTGIFLTGYLIRRFGYEISAGIALILYVIGLVGDNYFGLVEGCSALETIYSWIFCVSGYTRNGFFMAPIFLIMGGFIAQISGAFTRRKIRTGFMIAFLLLTLEGMLLYYYGTAKHTSMYLFLLPVMFFWFLILTSDKRKHNRQLSELTAAVYCVHPLIIVAIRFFAKLLKMEKLWIENSFLHFLGVTIMSFAVAIIFGCYRNGKRKEEKSTIKERAWIEISLENLRKNVRFLQKKMPQTCQLMAVVKTDAYGHGAEDIASYLEDVGVKSFAVATLEEGISLRKVGIRSEILILGQTPIHQVSLLHRYHLMQTLTDMDYAQALLKQKTKLHVHIKIDSGMHRMGFSLNQINAIQSIVASSYFSVEGIYTHLCVADSLKEEDIAFTKKQITDFYELIDRLRENNINIPKRHIQSSYGVIRYPNVTCDYARIGIALYGVLSRKANDDIEREWEKGLLPVLSLHSTISHISLLGAGKSAGYGLDFTADSDCRLAVVPIGYADGLPRNAFGKAHCLIRGQKAPIVGRLCMDQLLVDLRRIPEAKIGDTATFIGQSGSEEIRAEDWAKWCDTISNEILSRLGKRFQIKIR